MNKQSNDLFRRRYSCGHRIVPLLSLLMASGAALKSAPEAGAAPRAPIVEGNLKAAFVVCSEAEFSRELPKALAGDVRAKNTDPVPSVDKKGKPVKVVRKDYSGTITLPVSTGAAGDDPIYIGRLAIVSDDGCDISINGEEWLKEAGKGHDISKGFRQWSGLLVPGKKYTLNITYSQVRYVPDGPPDPDGISVFIITTPIQPVDLDIDSDNDNFTAPAVPGGRVDDALPDESPAEDQIENRTKGRGLPGKIIRPSALAPDPNGKWRSERPFTPLVLKLPDKKSFMTDERIQIIYEDAADPARYQAPGSQGAPAGMRLWRKNGLTEQSPARAPLGDYIAPTDSKESYSVRDLFGEGADKNEAVRRLVIYAQGSAPETVRKRIKVVHSFTVGRELVSTEDQVQVTLLKALERFRYRTSLTVCLDGGATTYAPYVWSKEAEALDKSHKAGTMPSQSVLPIPFNDDYLHLLQPAPGFLPRDNPVSASSASRAMVGYLLGNPMPQQPNGYYISRTGYSDWRIRADTSPGKFVDADTVNYVVLYVNAKAGLQLGDLVIAHDCSQGPSGANVLAIIGESGHSNGREASFALHQSFNDVTERNPYHTYWRLFDREANDARWAIHAFPGSVPSKGIFTGKSNAVAQQLAAYLGLDVTAENFAEECADYQQKGRQVDHEGVVNYEYKTSYLPKP